MAKNNKADMSCARVKKYTASDVSKAERHNERKNETYENMNVIEKRIPYEGAKQMLLVDEVDNKNFLAGLFNAMYEELPAPKPKKKK